MREQLKSVLYYTLPRKVFNRLILRKVSRTFAVTIPQIDRSMRQAAVVGYNLARVLDSFEDEGSKDAFPETERIILMDEFMLLMDRNRTDREHRRAIYRHISRFARDANITSHHYRVLLDNTRKVVRAKEKLHPEAQVIIVRWLEEMNSGMKKYLLKEVVQFSNLDEYCYYVAGTVGGMMTELMYHFSGNLPEPEHADPGLLQKAFSLGKFLQMVNIIRDFRQDALQKKDYWPASLFSKTFTKDISLSRQVVKSRAALQKMVAFAELHRKAAYEYIMGIANDLPGYRRFCLLNFIMVNKTLQIIKENSTKVFQSRTQLKFSRNFLFRILATDMEGLQHLAEGYVMGTPLAG